ncbi:S10 family peptidase [Salisaeta longa]|uniref:S10 family peptidase n=1 Tax=Salisaeta longa TaxID=503170 RepID=UPI0003B36A50|nr:peptidase S10 [Salisaeta longa]
MVRRVLLSVVGLFCLTGLVAAQAPDTLNGPPLYPDELSVTEHQVTVDGETIRYTATAGYLPLRQEDGTVQAYVFFTAYTRNDATAAQRPITYAFNGGPGSSSVWLHMGALGPKRVEAVTGKTNATPPPHGVQDNPHSWLKFTDLVFIDPVTTGYSRAAKGTDASAAFHGVEADIASVARFIRLYTTRYERWISPKFLVGESYGTTRAAGLAETLQEDHGMYLNGITLVSSVLNFQAYDFNVGNDLPYATYLPTYAATAHYHNELPAAQQQKSLDQLLADAERFAMNDYTLALRKGDRLADAKRQQIVDSLHAYTGLSRTFIENSNLRIHVFEFFKELLRAEDLTVGRFDSRFTGRDRRSTGATPDYDPSYAVIRGAYTSAFNHYVRTELGFTTDLPYEILTGRVWPWSYDTSENEYLNVAERLRSAIHKNPALHVHVASGYYDLATPYFASDYVLNHLQLAETYQDNISRSYYRAGHMMYLYQPALETLLENAEAFYQQALPE